MAFNIHRDGPTITSPNGGETFADGTIAIQWNEPSNIPSSEGVWYEIYLVEDFTTEEDSLLLQVATIPAGNSSFLYKIPKSIKGNRCRLAIRAINFKGERSRLVFTAADFTITNKKLPAPALLEPAPHSTYFSYVPFAFGHEAITGRCSQRAFYQVYYSSVKQSTDWTLLRGEIMVGSEPFNVDVSGLPTSDDYAFKVELVDGDNVSEPVFIESIVINNVNYFLVDTLPPKGRIKIVGNDEYLNTRDIIVSLTSYDETTGVKDFRIEQTNISPYNDEPASVEGSFSTITDLATWYITHSDGEKLIQARFRDYADNMVSTSGDETYFRTYKELDNREITAFLYYDGDIWFTFSGETNTSGELAQLYKNQSLIATLNWDATALEYYNSTLYVAVKDDENKGILQRFSAGVVETVQGNDDEYVDEEQTTLNTLYDADSVINDMVVFDGKLFMAMENGTLLSFDGATISTQNSTYENLKSIAVLRTDGVNLYIYFENSTEIMIMYKNTSGSYVFAEVDTGS